MDVVIAVMFSISLAALLAIQTSRNHIHPNHHDFINRRDWRSDLNSLLPVHNPTLPVHNPTPRETTAAMRIDCVVRRMSRGIHSLISNHFQFSFASVAYKIARAIIHAALLCATRIIGVHEPQILDFLRDFTLTAIYILMTSQSMITPPSLSPSSIPPDATTDTLNPYDWNITAEDNGEFRGIQLPERTYASTRHAASGLDCQQSERRVGGQRLRGFNSQ